MIVTTIEQSKKLLGLGLSPETADMYYRWGLDNFPYLEIGKDNISDTIPAWSLSALLMVMPKTIEQDDIDYKLIIDVADGFPKYYSVTYEIYHDDFPYPIRHENKSLFEYMVEGVIWLLQNNYIKKYDR